LSGLNEQQRCVFQAILIFTSLQFSYNQTALAANLDLFPNATLADGRTRFQTDPGAA
jgi:hypothetical protein